MSHVKNLARMMIMPAIGIVVLASNGCGNNNTVKLEPDGGQKIQQARINAYGPSGAAPTSATPGSGAGLSSQAAARQRSQQQGGR